MLWKKIFLLLLSDYFQIIFCVCPDAAGIKVSVFVCASTGNLGGEIRSCQRWSRCYNTSSHQCSPTLLLTYSTSALETTRSKPRFVSLCGFVIFLDLFNKPRGTYSPNIQTHRSFLLLMKTPTPPYNTPWINLPGHTEESIAFFSRIG